MKPDNSMRIIPAIEVSEGAGVSVYRSIGIPALRNYDPFIMLDQMDSGKLNDKNVLAQTLVTIDSGQIDFKAMQDYQSNSFVQDRVLHRQANRGQ